MAGAKVTNRLPSFVQDRQQRAVVGMTQALVLGASHAAAKTPIDTSTLLNSQYRDVRVEDGQVKGRVGYTAEYALAVHDPSHKQNFRRAGAEKEFLLHGMEEAAPQITGVLKAALQA